MNNQVQILLAEDDPGHATLIKRNLNRAGIKNDIKHFSDGQAVLDFFLSDNDESQLKNGKSYLLLLDIKMPKIDGIEVLEKIKSHAELKKIPVIMITTTDDPKVVDKCHSLGCNSYITKPVDYNKFINAIKKLGLFLMVVEVPTVEQE